MNIRKIIYSTLLLAALGSCSKVEEKFDRYLDNPNSPRPDAADSDLYLNVAELSFAGCFDAFSSYGMEITRMIVMYGPTYQNAYSPNSFDGVWDNAYTNFFKHANALIPIAEKQKKFVVVGMTKIMKAYVMMTLVDYFGNVPYADANLGAENTNPAAQQGKDVYAAAIKLLDEAIATLNQTPGSYPGAFDLFYNTTSAGATSTTPGGASTGAKRWITLAKTLQLRAYMTTRLVDATAKSKIEALIAGGDLIDNIAEDFEFKYSNKQTNPNSRHPRYNGNYSATGSAGDYIGTHYMWSLVYEDGRTFSNNTGTDKSDPRTRYYFYRQRINSADVNSASSSCSVAAPPAHYPTDFAVGPFCSPIPGFGGGFWGRDHGDNSGIPPDGPQRTTWGIYPAGGQFDAGQGTSVALNLGGQGAGIQPIWQSAFTEFLKAEAVLAMGVAGDAKALLEAGIKKSMAKVIGFPSTVGVTPSSTFVPTQARQDAYVASVLAAYDAAASNDAKLNIIMKEYYKALWGNGVDSYNNYRRTGKPDNLQLPIVSAPGAFISSMYYPSVHVNRNQSATQKSGVNVKVFWDTFAGTLK